MLMPALVRLTDRAVAGRPHRKVTTGPAAAWIGLLRRSPAYYRALWAAEQRARPSAPPAELVQIHLEPTNLCDLRCAGCHNPVQGAKTGTMPLARARRVIDEAVAVVGPRALVGFFLRGEPTLHPELGAMLRYARERGLTRLLVSSNVARIDEATAEALVSAGLSELRLSVDGAEPASFERIRRGASFARVLENVAMLHRVRRRLGAPVRFRLHAALDAAGLRDVPRLVRTFGGLVDRFKVTLLVNQGGLAAPERARALSGLRFATSTKFQRPCRLLWQYAGVTWDGKVSSCCVDYSDRFVTGRLDDGIRAAFDGPASRALRAAHVRGDLDPLCAACGFSNALVDWFEDELDAYVTRGASLLDPRRDAAYLAWLDRAVAKFDRLADEAERAAGGA